MLDQIMYSANKEQEIKYSHHSKYTVPGQCQCKAQEILVTSQQEASSSSKPA
jgi:hypothetical protein